MAGLLTHRITAMIDSIHAFQQGDLGRRLDARSADKMGELANSFNRMADSVEVVQTTRPGARGSRGASRRNRPSSPPCRTELRARR